MSAERELNTAAQDAYESFDSKQRRRKRTKHGRYVADITYEELSRCFNMPALQACAELGIGLTMVKRLSRKYGIMRWPFRKNRAERRVAGWEEQHDTTNSSDIDVTVDLAEAGLPTLKTFPSYRSGSDDVPAPIVSRTPASEGLRRQRLASSESSHINYHAATAVTDTPPHTAPPIPGFSALIADALSRIPPPPSPGVPVTTRALPVVLQASARLPRAPTAALGMLTELSRSHPNLLVQLVEALAANQADRRSGAQSHSQTAPPTRCAQPLRVHIGATNPSPFQPEAGLRPSTLVGHPSRPRGAAFGSSKSAFSAVAL